MGKRGKMIENLLDVGILEHTGACFQDKASMIFLCSYGLITDAIAQVLPKFQFENPGGLRRISEHHGTSWLKIYPPFFSSLLADLAGATPGDIMTCLDLILDQAGCADLCAICGMVALSTNMY